MANIHDIANRLIPGDIVRCIACGKHHKVFLREDGLFFRCGAREGQIHEQSGDVLRVTWYLAQEHTSGDE